jgi:hypothetical protein
VQYEVLNEAKYVDANEKMGDLRGGDFELNTDQRLRQQSKRSNPNQHACAA